MNKARRVLGLFWMVLAPWIIYTMINQAVLKIDSSNEIQRTNVTLQWGIIMTVFVPICIGFLIFGYYAFRGEYDDLI